MHKWKYTGVSGHIFTYDKSTGYISCTCGMLGTRVSREQMLPTSERHVRNTTYYLGSLILNDLSKFEQVREKW